MKVKTENISKSFIVDNRKIDVIKNVNFESLDKGITIILGKSGCGKTTFLRLLLGLEKADSGSVIVENNAKISIVFQESRLMPWLNVFDNIAFYMNKKKKIYTKIKYIALSI